MSTPPIPGIQRSGLAEFSLDHESGGTRADHHQDRRTYWRYEFAKHALAGLMANSDWTNAYCWVPTEAAESAVALADALLVELEGGVK